MFFILSFLFFSPKKSENRKVEQVLPMGGGLAQGKRGGVGERKGRKVNMVK
jgi:hypothetical protein